MSDQPKDSSSIGSSGGRFNFNRVFNHDTLRGIERTLVHRRVLMLLLFGIVVYFINTRQRTSSKWEMVRWGDTFQALIPPFDNEETNCSFGGTPICCALTDSSNYLNVSSSLLPSTSSSSPPSSSETAHESGCTVVSRYESSAYELAHYAKSIEIAVISNEATRKNMIIDFFIADIEDSRNWLERVRVRMFNPFAPVTDDDLKYLSRFHITKMCHGKAVENDTQWIEPLSMHARHPFALARGCREIFDRTIDRYLRECEKWGIKVESNSKIQDPDYVLIHYNDEKHRGLAHAHGDRGPTKKFLFDAGTSTFDSAMYWFVCAYHQRGIAFNEIYGWEYTLLKPAVFWSRVPDKLVPFYHFYNVPVNDTVDHAHNPFHVIKKKATKADFVAFKLDIDTPSVEIPLFEQLLRDPEVASLVDEFFFELHFRCELLMHCGWGVDIPQKMGSVILDRPHALELFRKARIAGVRAHFWP